MVLNMWLFELQTCSKQCVHSYNFFRYTRNGQSWTNWFTWEEWVVALKDLGKVLANRCI